MMVYEDSRKQEMYDWFHERFTEPELCEMGGSGASGYQYACGGPYFVRDIIPAEFGGTHPEDIILEVVGDIEFESHEWALRKAA